MGMPRHNTFRILLICLGIPLLSMHIQASNGVEIQLTARRIQVLRGTRLHGLRLRGGRRSPRTSMSSDKMPWRPPESEDRGSLSEEPSGSEQKTPRTPRTPVYQGVATGKASGNSLLKLLQQGDDEEEEGVKGESVREVQGGSEDELQDEDVEMGGGALAREMIRRAKAQADEDERGPWESAMSECSELE